MSHEINYYNVLRFIENAYHRLKNMSVYISCDLIRTKVIWLDCLSTDNICMWEMYTYVIYFNACILYYIE